LNISNPEFMTGGALSFQGSAVTIVTNLGDIFSRNGSIFLIAYSVNNQGTLKAANGSVGVGAGSRILLKDSTTDQRIFVSAAGGDVTNTGVIAAAQVELKTKGGNIYALAGNNGGQISATGTANIDGKVWLVAESGTTNVTGTISAQNADATGGAIETSGRQLAISGAIVKTGRNGSWLLDPDDLIIDTSLAATISAALNGNTNVTETTSAPTSGGQGDIDVNASIGWNTNSALTLSAYHDININNGVTIHNDFAYTQNNQPFYESGSLTLRADNTGTGTGTVNFNGTGAVNFSQSVGLVSILYNPTDLGSGKYNNPTDYSSHVVSSSAYVVPPDSLVSQFTPYMLVNSVQDLQNINTNLSGTYGLTGSLDAGGFMSFTPIGSDTTPFTGVLDGFGNIVSNLRVGTFGTEAGLFGVNAGVIRNVGLMNVNARAAGGGTAGGLAGASSGTIFSAFSNGQVNGYITGGLVGDNSGQITNAYAMGNVTGGISGGLVGQNEVTGLIATSYSTATADSGLVGNNLPGGSILNSYWDMDNSGTSVTSGAGTGVSRTTLQSAVPVGFDYGVWQIGAIGFSYPYLKWQFPIGIPVAITGKVYTDQSQTRTNSDQAVQAIVNGVDVGQTVYTGADGYYYLLIAPAQAPTTTGGVITYLTNGPTGNAFSDLNGPGFSLPITNNYLTLQSRTTSLTGIVGNLSAAVGGLGGNPNLLFSIASGNVLTVNTGNLDLATDSGSLAIDQPIAVTNLIIEDFANTTQTSAISVDNLSLLGPGNFSLINAANTIQTLATAPARNLPLQEERIVRSPFSNRGVFAIPRPLFALPPQTISVFAQGNLHIGTTDAAMGLFSLNSAIVSASGTLTIDRGVPVVEADGTGVSLILTDGDAFYNSSRLGAATLATPNGAWQVWSQNPANDTRGGIAYDFKQYNATFGVTAAAESDSGVLYTAAPVLTPSISPVMKQYDSTVHAAVNPAGYSFTGAIDGDTVTLNDPASGSFSDKNVGTNKTITVTGISDTAIDGSARVYGYQLPSTLVATNAGTITPAPLVAVTSAADKVYDGTRTDTGATVLSGVFAGDNVSLAAGATYTFADKNAGSGKAVTVAGLSLTGVDDGNYTLSFNSPVANITPAELTASYATNNKVYDGNTLATGLFASLSGTVPGDSVFLTGSPTFNFSDKNAGSAKPIAISGVSLGGADAADYTLSFSSVANITPAQVTETFAANGKVYDGTTAATGTLSGGLSGVISGDSLALSGTASYNFSDKNAGASKSVSASGVTLTGSDAGNYTLTLLQIGTSAITPAQLLYLANTGTRPFGAANPPLSGSITGLVGGDTLAAAATGTAIFTSLAADSSPVGSYAVNGSGLTLITNNYTIGQAAGNLTALGINPISISVGSVYRYFGVPNPTFTVSYSGTPSAYLQSILNSLKLVTNAPASDAPGAYQITAVVPAEFAGDIVVQPGTLTIAFKPDVQLPAVLQNQYQAPPPLFSAVADSGNLLLPGNAIGIFHIDIRASQDWGNGFQGGQILGNPMSSASFTEQSPNGTTTDNRSIYAAGAHQ
jgi:trimeric autotransporter adhesin